MPHPSKVHVRNQEGAYWADFLARTTQTFPEPSEHIPEAAEDDAWALSSQHAAVAVEKQKCFFKAVDTFHAEVQDEFCKPQAAHRRADYDSALSTAMHKLNKRYTRSRTVVLEVAFFLLAQGLLTIPDLGTANVKQARAFLWNAVWLQEHMNEEWSADDIVPAPPGAQSDIVHSFALAIIGPGGTGKTAVLKATEALIAFFAGPEKVQKLAPSNAAA